jgi:hypothetical protein
MSLLGRPLAFASDGIYFPLRVRQSEAEITALQVLRELRADRAPASIPAGVS